MACLAPASFAAPAVYVANLLGSNEVPASGSAGSGTGIVTVDSVAHTMRVNVTFSGLGSGVTASHIHCCQATPGANANIGVATTTPTFTGFPSGVTSGTYDRTFDLTSATSYNPAFIAGALVPNHTVAQAETVLINGIQNLSTYLNIHTTGFPGGEIRGVLVAPKLLPRVPAGAGSNAAAVAGAVDAVFASGSAPAEFVSLFLNVAPASLPDALIRIAGQNEDAAAQSAHESARLFLGLVLDPSAGARSGQQQGLGGGTLWGAVYGSHARIAGSTATGTQRETNEGGALAIGYDYSASPGTVFGAAFSYDHRNFHVAQNFGSGQDNSYQFALYGTADLDALYLSAAGTYSVHDVRTMRSVAISAGTGSYSASYTGHGLGGRFEAGLHLPMDNLDLTPFAALVADTITLPAHQEQTQSGTSTFAMRSAKDSFNRLRGELGVGWNNALEGTDSPLLHGRIGWAHEFTNADSIPVAFSAFPGQSFTLAGTKLKDTGFLSAGLTFQVSPGAALGVGFEGNFGSTTGYSGGVQLRAAL